MNIQNKLEDFWQGKIPLWKSYWIVGEVINAFIVIIIFNIELKFFNNTKIFQNIPLLSFNNLRLFTVSLIKEAGVQSCLHPEISIKKFCHSPSHC